MRSRRDLHREVIHRSDVDCVPQVVDGLARPISSRNLGGCSRNLGGSDAFLIFAKISGFFK
eukprot:SAG22_NODE_1425_length_4459_cov_5.864220_8_plen_60_part_01